jgi:hypothetical protein
MSRLLAVGALLIGVGLAPGKDPLPPVEHGGETDAYELAIYLDFEAERSEVAVEAMKAEVAAIMQPVGLNLQWRELEDSGASESFRELAVMRFTGRCQMDPFPVFQEHSPTLGIAKISDGEILPFGEIACSRVQHVIYSQLGTDDQRKRDGLMGRALGRVVAHELYHILSKSTCHAAKGVAKPYYTA